MTLSGLSFRNIAIFIVLILIIYFIYRLANRKLNNDNRLDLYLIATFSAFAVPFLMTSAHENHLFLGTVLIIPVMAMTRNIIFKIAVHVILLLQFINLYGYYHVGELNNIKVPNINYNYNKALILSMIAFFAFLIMLYFFLGKNTRLFLHKNNQDTADI